MKILIVGPLDPTHKADKTTRCAIAKALELNLDVYLWPTSIASPFPHAYLLEKELRAPFDVVLHTHDAQHMSLDESTYGSSPIRVAYLLPSNSPNAKKSLAGRLAAYTMVIPANTKAKELIGTAHPVVTEPENISSVVEQLAQLPTRQWPEMTYTTSQNVQAFFTFTNDTSTSPDQVAKGIEDLEALYQWR